MKWAFILTMALVAGEPLVAPPPSPPCLSESEIKEAQKQVQFLKEYDPQDLCRPETRTYKLAEAILFLKNFRWDKEKNKLNPLDSNIMPDTFWDFFVGSPAKTIQDGEDTPNNVGVVAASLGMLRDGNIFVMKAFYEDKTPTALRAAVLLHEAQHFHEEPHVVCRRGGARNCDEKIEDKGSWAVTMEALSKMMIAASPSPHLTPQVLQQLKQEMLQMSYYVFNQNVYLNAVYLMEDNGDAFIYDGKKLYPVRAVTGAKLISRNLNLLSFPDDMSDNSALDVLKSTLPPLPPTGSVAQRYLETPRADRKKIIDLFNLENCSVSVTVDSALFRDWPQVLIRDWTPVRAFCGNEGMATSESSVYVTDTDGKAHEFYLESGRVLQKTLAENPFRGWLMFATLKNESLALGESGSIYLKNSSQEWVRHPRFENRHFTIMTRPFLWTALVFDESSSVPEDPSGRGSN